MTDSELESVSADQASLGTRASRGATWMFGLNMSNRVMGLVRTAIIAHLLMPHDFGLFGVAMLFQSLLETFSQVGIVSALVRRPGSIRGYVDTAWVICWARGLGVAAVMVLGAPLAADFFHQPDAVPLIRVLALTAVLGGFANVAIVELRRRLQFRPIYLLETVASVVDVVVSIAFVLAYRSAMALVLGLVARYVVWSAMTYLVAPYRPRARFRLSQARELLGYGKWITGSTVLRFAYGQGDDILVGRVLGASSLGLYQIAYKYSNLPTTEITRVVQQVALPAYASVQADRARLSRGFLQAMTLISILSLPFAGFIWVIAADFVHVVLGSQWAAAIPLLQILAVWGAVESISEIPISLFEATGRPQLGTRLLLIKTLVLAAVIYPCALAWGVNGVAAAVLASSLPGLVVSLGSASSVSGARVRSILETLLVPGCAAVIAAVAGVLLSMVVDEGNVTSLVARTGLVAVVYLLVAVVARALGYRGLSLARQRLREAIAR